MYLASCVSVKGCTKRPTVVCVPAFARNLCAAIVKEQRSQSKFWAALWTGTGFGGLDLLRLRWVLQGVVKQTWLRGVQTTAAELGWIRMLLLEGFKTSRVAHMFVEHPRSLRLMIWIILNIRVHITLLICWLEFPSATYAGQPSCC